MPKLCCCTERICLQLSVAYFPHVTVSPTHMRELKIARKTVFHFSLSLCPCLFLCVSSASSSFCVSSIVLFLCDPMSFLAKAEGTQEVAHHSCDLSSCVTAPEGRIALSASRHSRTSCCARSPEELPSIFCSAFARATAEGGWRLPSFTSLVVSSTANTHRIPLQLVQFSRAQIPLWS